MDREEPGRLLSMGSQKVEHDLATEQQHIEFVTIVVLGGGAALFVFLTFFWPQGMCDLSSPTRGQTPTLWTGK